MPLVNNTKPTYDDVELGLDDAEALSRNRRQSHRTQDRGAWSSPIIEETMLDVKCLAPSHKNAKFLLVTMKEAVDGTEKLILETA